MTNEWVELRGGIGNRLMVRPDAVISVAEKREGGCVVFTETGGQIHVDLGLDDVLDLLDGIDG